MNPHDTKLLPIFSMCFAANVLCVLDRLNISITAPFIMERYGFNETQMGFVFSAFFVGYVVFMIPGGIVAQRFGARKALAVGMAVWSFFTLLTPFFSRIGSLFVCRYLIGSGQGVNFPCINDLIANRVPLIHRAKAQGFTLSGMTLGMVIGFPLGSWIIGMWGWPAVFYVFGLFGFVWILFWLRIVPQEVREAAGGSDSQPTPTPWKRFFSHPSSLGLTVSYFCHNYSGYLFLVWLPTYLMKVYGFSITGTGIGAAVPAMAAAVFMNLSGWFSDHLIKKGRSREFSRKLLLYNGMGFSGALLITLIWIRNPYLAVGVLTLSSACKGLATPVYWTLAVDMAPRHAGILSSIMNTSGNIAGIVASLLTGWILSTFSDWNPVLLVAAGITLFGVVVAIPTIRSEEVF